MGIPAEEAAGAEPQAARRTRHSIAIKMQICILIRFTISPVRGKCCRSSWEASMPRKKRDTKRTGQRKGRLPLGAVGLALSLTGVTSAESSVPASASVEKPARQEMAVDLSEEEVSDVTMASFYVFDNENPGGLRPDVRGQHMARCGSCRRPYRGNYQRRSCRTCG
jgi:hypothetical protein